MYQRGLSVLSCEQITIHKIKNRRKEEYMADHKNKKQNEIRLIVNGFRSVF